LRKLKQFQQQEHKKGKRAILELAESRQVKAGLLSKVRRKQGFSLRSIRQIVAVAQLLVAPFGSAKQARASR